MTISMLIVGIYYSVHNINGLWWLLLLCYQWLYAHYSTIQCTTSTIDSRVVYINFEAYSEKCLKLSSTIAWIMSTTVILSAHLDAKEWRWNFLKLLELLCFPMKIISLSHLFDFFIFIFFFILGIMASYFFIILRFIFAFFYCSSLR